MSNLKLSQPSMKFIFGPEKKEFQGMAPKIIIIFSYNQPCKLNEESPKIKLLWSQDLQNDLANISCDNKCYKGKLIFKNLRNAGEAEVYKIMIKELKKRCAEGNKVFQHNV